MEKKEQTFDGGVDKLAGGTNGLSTINEEFQQLQAASSARVKEGKNHSIDVGS